VRDFILGVPSKDHDIATSADPDELCRLFPNAVTVGKAFGVIKVPLGGEGPEFLEIATFREDLEYRDHRHPKAVRFSGPQEDARRRDFTINALYYDPKTSRILDSTGGMEDLKRGVVRAIGVADERFREDALRLLRAIRFATQFGFALDPATAEAIRARSKLIAKISPERIREELTRMWMGPRPAESLELLSKQSLLTYVLPELDHLHGLKQPVGAYGESDAWKSLLRTLRVLAKQSPARSSRLAWAAILSDIGKPKAARKSAGKNFNEHETMGAAMAAEIVARLKFSRADGDQIVAMILDHLKFREVFSMREATLERFVREPHFEEMLALHKAQATASDGNLAFYEFCAYRLAAARTASAEPRLIDGKDLIQLGLMPGKEFSEILRAVEDLALERKLRTKEEALEYIVKHFVE